MKTETELFENALDTTSVNGKKLIEYVNENYISNSILDKLIDEIMDTGAYEQEVNGNTEFLKGINYSLSVIDKYKTESEDKE